MEWNVSSYKWPYLGNGERYDQGYYQSLIGSGLRPFRWSVNHRPWMTFEVSYNQYGQLYPSDSWAFCCNSLSIDGLKFSECTLITLQ